jgi:hypothetical protein
MRCFVVAFLAVLSAFGNSALGQTDKIPANSTNDNVAAVVPGGSSLSCPTATGVYYRSGSDWKLMEEIHSSGFHTTGVAKMAFSYGAAAAKVKALFRESRSPYQVTNTNTQFCIVRVTEQGRDLTIVRMQEEKDRRELETASMRMWSGVSSQVKDDKLLKIGVEKLADKTYLVTSLAPIPSGEYMLFTIVPDTQALVKANTPSALGGYDFGFHPK